MSDDEQPVEPQPEVTAVLKKRRTVSVETYRSVRSGKFGRKIVTVRPHTREQDVNVSDEPRPRFWKGLTRRRKRTQDDTEKEDAERTANMLEGK